MRKLCWHSYEDQELRSKAAGLLGSDDINAVQESDIVGDEW